jgi:hypothetical protein
MLKADIAFGFDYVSQQKSKSKTLHVAYKFN